MTETTLLTQDRILAAALKGEEIEIPEWGGSVTVRQMTGAERDAFEQLLSDRKAAAKRKAQETGEAEDLNIRGIKAFIAVHSCPQLRGMDPEELNETHAAAAIDRIYQASQRINHLLPEDVDELAKN